MHWVLVVACERSLTRDRTRDPCIGVQSLSHWTTEEVPYNTEFLKYKYVPYKIGDIFNTKNYLLFIWNLNLTDNLYFNTLSLTTLIVGN